ncbi:MAG: 50S ribosomal L9 C-terminal domain-containing protein, partial [Actinomycetota bacterium]
AVEQASTVKKSRAVREAADRDSARAIATACSATPRGDTATAGATGKLFVSVTAADIVEAVERQFHVVVERKHVSIEHPIREVGTHQVSVALFADMRGTLNIEVRVG